jgi:farnesyl-diphosphate farnesyltransferase
MSVRSATIEHASGKGSGDENFPVGSFLIAKPLRRHVMAFYRFARNADDVADAPDLESGEKIRRLDRMGAVLDGASFDDAPAAALMRQSLLETGMDPVHCHDLLAAFRQDAVKNRYESWQELMDYCRLSAAPVGRFLLDLHGEDRATWVASDALCAALQVINHLQDCGQDYCDLDRVYLPLDWLAEDRATVADLAAASCSTGLRLTLDRCVQATRALVDLAMTLPVGVKDRGMRSESAIIVGLADRLLLALAAKDPLMVRVKLGPAEIAWTVLGGVWRANIGKQR